MQGSPAKPGFSLADTTKQGEISSKQQGMSNSPTRHSIPVHETNEQSKKPEGGPDSAKAMGTIDSRRLRSIKYWAISVERNFVLC